MPAIDPLYTLLTVNEAASLFFVSPKTIRYHIMRENIQARKADSDLRGLWLISYQSLVDYFGEPKSSSVLPTGKPTLRSILI